MMISGISYWVRLDWVKGQLISKGNFDIFKSTKKTTKFLQGFLLQPPEDVESIQLELLISLPLFRGLGKILTKISLVFG